MADSASQMFNIPQVHDRSELVAYRRSVSEAEAALSVAKQQIACIEIEGLFEDHPQLASLSLSGEQQSDDEGGAYWYIRASAEVDDHVAAGGSVEWDADDFESAAQDILDDWAELLDGDVITRANCAQKIGEMIMGDHEFAQWQAQRAKSALEAEVPSAAPSGKGGPRV